MELDRRLKVGDLVRILPGEEIREKMDTFGYMPEMNGDSLKFADAMFEFCGMECVIMECESATNRVRLTPADGSADHDLSQWWWCPSMLEDVEDEIVALPIRPDFSTGWKPESTGPYRNGQRHRLITGRLRVRVPPAPFDL